MAVCLLALLGCGLETFYYIDNIGPSDYRNETFSSIDLPSDGREGYGSNQYFTNFIIFYRIYLSNDNPTGKLDNHGDILNSINPALLSDYNWAIPYTDVTSTTVNTSNLDNTFYNRRYFKLELGEYRIDSVLGRSALDSKLEIVFYDDESQEPVLRLDNVPYVLQRATSAPGIILDPQPPFTNSRNRAFFNHPEFRNAGQEKNADIAPNSSADIRYTYVSMYIAAVGRSFEMPPRTIYSQPTFLGIFRLP
jgi:hypothetical protein